MTKITKAQLTEWENKYGILKKIVLDRETTLQKDPQTGIEKKVVINPGKVAYLRKPDRATIKYAMSHQLKVDGENLDMITPGEIVLNKCFLGGNEEMRTEDKYFFRAAVEAYKWLNEVTGFLSGS